MLVVACARPVSNRHRRFRSGTFAGRWTWPGTSTRHAAPSELRADTAHADTARCASTRYAWFGGDGLARASMIPDPGSNHGRVVERCRAHWCRGPPYWPLFDLEVRTPLLTLRYPDDALMVELVTLIGKGIHDPEDMPFALPWTDEVSPGRDWNSYRYWWRTAPTCRRTLGRSTSRSWSVAGWLERRDG